jgi:nitrite reductase/ring-hydroxylating ferredoxin subunit
VSFLCCSEALAEGAAKGITLGEGLAQRYVLLVRKNGLFAYVNSCPHQGTPLETFVDRFFTADGKFLLCSTHGAQFRIEDGLCIYGPCLGKHLAPLAISEEAGEIRLS